MEVSIIYILSRPANIHAQNLGKAQYIRNIRIFLNKVDAKNSIIINNLAINVRIRFHNNRRIQLHIREM